MTDRIEIPQRLKDPNFRFILILPKSKRAFEEEWQKKNNYQWFNSKLQKHIARGGNYGVVGGYGNLLFIDADVPEISWIVEKKLPKTFSVKSGKGKHYYFICEDWGLGNNDDVQNVSLDVSKDNQHLIKTIPQEKIEESIKTRKPINLGHIKAKSGYVVGPNSIHPSGKKYEVADDIAIAKVTREQIINALYPFISHDLLYGKDYQAREEELQRLSNKGIKEPSIIEVMKKSGVDFSKFVKHNRHGTIEYQGAHPIHGSESGINFTINQTKNVWHCFRHNSGGGPLMWVAVAEHIINCEDAKKGKLRGEKFKQAIKLAIKKYGFEKTDEEKVGELDVDEIAVELYNLNPYFFDKSRRYWFWKKNHYEEVDEHDIHNFLLSYGLIPKTLKVSEMSRLWLAIKAFGRSKIPKIPPPEWIQFQDIIYDISSDNTFEATPNYFFANPIPWKIGDSEETPTIDKYFEQWVGKEKPQLLYELIAYSMYREYKIQKFFILFGRGANGKGEFLKVLHKFLEGCLPSNKNKSINYVGFRFSQIIGGHKFETSKLYKKLVAVASEISDTLIKDTTLLKQLTGDEKISSEQKFKAPFDFYNYAKIIINANAIPSTHDKTYGFYRRIMIINFPNQFDTTGGLSPAAKVPNVEFQNLAKKSLRILKELIDRGKFCCNNSVSSMKILYEKFANPISTFLDEETIRLDGESVPLSVLYDYYSKWFMEHKGLYNETWLSQKTFRQTIQNLGYIITYENVSQDEARSWGREVGESGTKWAMVKNIVINRIYNTKQRIKLHLEIEPMEDVVFGVCSLCGEYKQLTHRYQGNKLICTSCAKKLEGLNNEKKD